MSILLRPPLEPAQVPPLTLLAGAAVARSLKQATASSLNPRLKWPNDVVIVTPTGTLKLSGILVEMATRKTSTGFATRHVVVGIGVNVNASQHDYPEDLRPFVTTMRAQSQRLFNRAQLAAAIRGAFFQEYAAYLEKGIAHAVSQWRPFALFGTPCTVTTADGATVTGRTRDIDPTGALIAVDDAGRLHKVLSGPQ